MRNESRTQTHRARLRRWPVALMTLVLAGVIVAPLSAQERGQRRAPDPEKRLEMLQEKLELSDDQVSAIREIFAESQEARQALREQAQADRDAMRAEFRALREQIDEQLAGVLTADQMAELREMRDSRRRGPRHGHRRGSRDKDDSSDADSGGSEDQDG